MQRERGNTESGRNGRDDGLLPWWVWAVLAWATTANGLYRMWAGLE